MRLNAYLARAGVASRRGADDLIKARRVTVDGAPGELNTFVGGSSVVRVDGREVGKQALRHVLLNKPRGTITTARDPKGRPTVVDLVGGDIRVVPVGRLDRDTTGVLILTNDGPLAHRLAHPRYEVEKAYIAEVQGQPGDAVLRRLAEGVELDDGPTAPARVTRLGPSQIEVVLHEGRNRQLRRMLEAVGHPVVRLRRARYAGLGPDDRVARRFEHAPELAVTTLVEHDLDLRRPEPGDARRRRRPVVELDPLGEPNSSTTSPGWPWTSAM